MVSQTFLLALSFAVLLAQLILSRFSDSLLILSDAAHTIYILIGICPQVIQTHCPSLPHYARVRLPTLFSLLAPLFLSSFGLSLALMSLGRIVRPHSPQRPVLILVAGAVGLLVKVMHIVTSKVWKGFHLPRTQKTRWRWTPVMLILASLAPSTFLLLSGLSFYLFSHPVLHYMDAALCLASVTIMAASVYSSIVQNGYILLQSVPPCTDLAILRQDLDILCGPKGHHELHVWALAQGHSVATLHLSCSGPEAYQEILKLVIPLFGRHGVEEVTIQPEFGSPGPCRVACGQSCANHLCCVTGEPEPKGLVLANICA
uniref:Solute carrier family 30 member 1 n=1 Tax=Leptobrachium leishanense TaxID=445787 RepID=A0A8C5Q4Y1_9ANUR